MSHDTAPLSGLKILITGGAGFIGSRLARELLAAGSHVTVLDNFNPQIHESSDLPAELVDRVALVRGDVSDPEAVTRALDGQQAVVHLAAETGTGQSMYAVSRYERTNGLGTAVLLDALVNSPVRTVRRLVVASSRAVYGEGSYRCATHGIVAPKAREARDMVAGHFEPRCPSCGDFCSGAATREDSFPGASSYYGLTKYLQERAVLLFGETLGIPAIALRFQNVFGPGQSLRNPYTGILAVFSNLARAGKPIQVFEDGHESRDFIFVGDAVRSIVHALQAAPEVTGAFNIGTGRPTSVLDVAHSLCRLGGWNVPVGVTGAFRLGDIRHAFADPEHAREVLGFEARVSFEDGLAQFLAWASSQEVPETRFEESLQELKSRGLMHDSR